MGRYTGPKHKLSRRAGMPLFGPLSKAEARRLATPPGAHGTKRPRRPSEFAVQLREKQKVKQMYGLQERQFRRFFQMAERERGEVGLNLLRLLERRLDNVVYRMGWAATRPMGRQLVSHGHLLVNGRRVNIPSYIVQPGEALALDETAMQIPVVQELLKGAAPPLPGWLRRQDGVGQVTGLPERADLEPHIQEHLIVEYYSR